MSEYDPIPEMRANLGMPAPRLKRGLMAKALGFDLVDQAKRQWETNPLGFIPPHVMEAAKRAAMVSKLIGPLADAQDVADYQQYGSAMAANLQKGNMHQALLHDAPLAAASGLAMAVPMMGGIAGKIDDAVTGIRAYHGSPHDFDKFDMGKIGTGEGAQAYGHGLYFAELEQVANEYKTSLTRAFNENVPAYRAAQDWVEQWGTPAQAREEIDKSILSFRDRGDETLAREYEAIRSQLDAPNKGRMYEVNINAHPDEFLDWDKPLSDQPKAVRDAIPRPPLKVREIGFNEAIGEKLYDVTMGGGSLGAFPESKLNEILADPGKYDPRSGALAYESEHLVPGDYTDKVTASDRLRAAGLKGIKYLDQGSRGSSQGTRNYVVFDDKLINIIRKYGFIPGALGLGAAGTMMSSGDDA